MYFDVERSLDILQRTPGTLRAMVQDLSDEWVYGNYGESTFSPFDIVGHLIHGERTDWMPRARIILAHGESHPFDPFDRYAMYDENKGRSMGELLDTFASLRGENTAALQTLKLTDDDLDRRGTHPELGPVTLRHLLAMWVVHDLNHIAQLAKAMAHQYRDHVGPWLAYTSILNR